MVFLVIFAFIAGIVTILSPCILPVLPIILSSSVSAKENSKSRPFGIILGFIASFTFFTLFLSALVRLTGVSADLLRTVSIIVIASFGISLLVPRFQIFLERLFTSFGKIVPQGNKNPSFVSGILVGLSLGLLWTPCVGPIIASVIALAVTGTVTIDTFIVTLAYSIGTAIPMFGVMIGGQALLKKVPWLLGNTEKIQKAFGLIMVLTALAIFAGFDRSFQTFVIEKFPSYGAGLTTFENVDVVRDNLKNVGGRGPNKSDMGKPSFILTDKGAPAPEIIAGGEWFNSRPLKLQDLRGKVILVDFWTYSCINCQRTLPYLKSWWAKYNSKGLVVIGVHSPEFEFEKNPENVKKALAELGVSYPVVQDNNFATWRAYQNQFWPAKYLIDQDGFVVYHHFGEGNYNETETEIQKLLKDTGVSSMPDKPNNPSYQTFARSPETYFGYDRVSGLVSNEPIKEDVASSYSAPDELPSNSFAYVGKWLISHEFAAAQPGSQIILRFNAKNVYMVMGPTGKPVKVKVTLDEKVIGEILVSSHDLFKLVELEAPGEHILRIEFESGGVQAYTFTFG
jgi:cytochrome c biogenesis protein CcdA/thiol-disulfide isomerase/thioredoxin